MSNNQNGYVTNRPQPQLIENKQKTNSAKIREQLKGNVQPIGETDEYKSINIHQFNFE